MSLLVPRALAWATPDDWSVRVADVRGDWLSHLRIDRLQLDGPTGSVSVDSLSVDYALFPLFRKTIVLGEIRVVEPNVRIEHEAREDGGSREERSEAASSGLEAPLGDWTLAVERLRIARGSLERRAADDRHKVDDLEMSAGLALSPDGIALDLDSLVARVYPPKDEPWAGSAKAGMLRVAAHFERGLLRLEELAFVTERSEVEGSGSIALTSLAALPTDPDTFDFELHAAPLDLRDLPLELPEPLATSPTVTVDVTSWSTGDTVVVEARAEAAGRTRIEARAALPTPLDATASGGAGPGLIVVVDAETELDSWASTALLGHLSLEARAEADRVSADAPLTVRGSFVHTPPAERSDTLRHLLAAPLRGELRLSRRPSGEAAGGGLTTAAELVLHARDAERAPGPWTRLGTAAADVGGDSASWRIDLGLDSATVRGRGTASWGGDGFAVRVSALDLERLDGQALAAALPPSSFSGRARGRVRSRPSGLEGSVRLTLGSSTVGSVTLDTLALDATLDPGRIAGALFAAETRGRLTTDYAVLLADSAIEAELTDLRLATDTARSAEGTITGRWTSGGRASGEAQLELAGVPLAPLSVTASLDGTVEEGGPTGDLRLIAEDTAADSLSITLTAGEEGDYVLDGTLSTPEGGRIEIAGGATQTPDRLAFQVTADGSLAAPAELLSGARADSLHFDASGRRERTQWIDLAAVVAVAGGEWRGVTVDAARASVRSDSSGFALDTLQVDSEALTLRGAGTLPAKGEGTGRLEVIGTLDLEPLRGLTEVELPTIASTEMTAVVSGTTDSIDVSTTWGLSSLAYGDFQANGLDLEARALLEPPFQDVFGLTSGAADLHLERLALRHAEVRSIDVRLEGGADSVRLDASALVDDRRRGELLAQIDPRPDRRTARIERLDLQLDRDRWTLAEPALFTYRDGYDLESFALAADGQSIDIDGGIDGTGTIDLTLDVDSAEVSTLTDLAGFPQLAGWFSGRAQLGGTTAAPTGQVDMRVGVHRAGRPSSTATTATVALETSGGRVHTDVAVDDPGGGTLRLGGSLLAFGGDSGSGGLDLRIRADSFSIAAAEAFLPPGRIADLRGRVGADLTVTGPRDDPELEGRLGLTAARVDIPPLGVTWEDIRLEVHGSGRDLIVDSGGVASTNGALELSGTVSFSEGIPLDLDARLDQFQAIRNDAYRAAVSGDLHAGGSASAPELDGRVRLESLDVYLDERVADNGLEEIELSEEDLAMLRDRFGYVPEPTGTGTPFAQRLTADIVVELGRDSWIRKRSSPEMAVAFTGSIDVRLRPDEEPRLQGSVETIPGRGYVEQFGRRFDLREGTVTFDGPPASARMDLEATYTIPSHDNPDDAEATIVLGIEGTRETLALDLSSEPPMENADIVSYIATGRPASGNLTVGGREEGVSDDGAQSGLVGAGTNLALGQLTGIIESAARRSIGLDVVEIRREGLRKATLVAGKYVSPRLYVGFSQPISHREGDGLSLGDEGESEIEMEYEALRWLLLNVEGSGSAFRFFLRGRYAY